MRGVHTSTIVATQPDLTSRIGEVVNGRTSTPNRRPLPAHASPNPIRFPWIRTIAASLVAVFLFTSVAGALMLNNLDRQIKDSVLITEHLGAIPQSGEEEEEEAPADKFAGRAVNLLVSGIDSRYDEDGQIGENSDPTIRSDTTLIMHIAKDRKSVTVLSIPRDMKVTIPACRLSDGSESWEYYGMFNSAFSTGAGLDDIAGGIACTQAAAEAFTGINIDGFVVIDFAGFAKLVDALGGVDMCVEEDLYDKEAKLDLEAGCQTLDGTQALAFARARKMLADGSDTKRIDRQQLLIGLMISQVLDSNILTDLPSLYALVQEAMATSKLSPSLDNLRTDAGLLNSVRSAPKDHIRFVTVPYETDPEDPNRLVPEYYQAEEVFAALISDEPLPPGTVFRDLDNDTYVVGPDGEAIPSDEYGVPLESDTEESDETDSFSGEDETQ